MKFFDDEVERATKPGSSVGVAELGHTAVRDQLSDYLDDSLPQRERAFLDEHLLSCRPCRIYKATVESTVRAVSGLPREKAPAPVKQRLLQISKD